MPVPHVDAVANAKIKVAAKFGDAFLLSPCGAFEIVKTAVWDLRNNGEEIGLVDKPSGNNCAGYSVDGVMYKDGTFADVLTDAGGANVPAWNFGAPIDPDRWRPPIDPGNQVPSPPPPTNPGGSVIPYDEQKSIQFGLACNDVYNQSGAPMDPGMISVHSQRAAWDYYVGGLDWPDSFKKHLNEFRAVYGLPPIP